MTKLKILYVLSSIVLIGGGFGVKALWDQKRELQDSLKQTQAALQSEKSELQKLRADLDGEKNRFQQKTKQDLAVLKQELIAKIDDYNKLRAKLEVERDQIEALKKKGKNGQISVLENQIKMNQARSQDLDREIKGYDSSEKDLNNESKAALADQKKQFETALAQGNQAVKEQTDQIHKTQDDMKFWQKRTRDINQGDHLKQLQGQLDDQNQQLALMKQQVEALHSSQSQNTAVIRSQASIERDNIHDSLGQLKSQFKNVQSELKSQQEQLARLQKGGQENLNQLQQLEAQYTQEYSQLQGLEVEIQRKKSELQQLGAL